MRATGCCCWTCTTADAASRRSCTAHRQMGAARNLFGAFLRSFDSWYRLFSSPKFPFFAIFIKNQCATAEFLLQIVLASSLKLKQSHLVSYMINLIHKSINFGFTTGSRDSKYLAFLPLSQKSEDKACIYD